MAIIGALYIYVKFVWHSESREGQTFFCDDVPPDKKV